MKKLWWAAAVLALIFTATLVNSYYVTGITDSLAAQLTRAEELAEAGEWDRAEQLTLTVQEQWENKTDYLYTVLRHSDIDAVNVGFYEVLEFLYCEEGGEYSAANAELIAQINLLSDMEQLNWKNVL